MGEEIHVDTTPEVYDFMQQHGLNDAHIDTGALNLTAAGITKTYFSVPTPVRQALEIWGLISNLKISIASSLVALSSSAQVVLAGRVLLTYTQPQPPATNSTTDASTTGNLEFRNGYYDEQFNTGIGITQPATQGVQLGPEAKQTTNILLLKKPRRIACSQLESQVIVETASSVGASLVDYVADILYRFVTVSEQEYNALVALSSGQAVLSEVIVA